MRLQNTAKWLLIISLVLVASCARDKYQHQQNELEAVKKAGSLQAFDDFLAQHPDSDWQETTLYYRDEFWVETARKNKDKESLIQFLHERPDSKWVETAHHYLEHGFGAQSSGQDAACGGACHNGKAEPGHALLSPHHREKTQLAEVQKLNTVEAYNTFLKEFPDSQHRDVIIYQRDELWVKQAIERKDRQSLTDFLHHNPDSKWFDHGHYYLRNKFKVAQHDDTNDCSNCHQNDFLMKVKPNWADKPLKTSGL